MEGFCVQCGKPIFEGFAFCGSCGKPIEKPSAAIPSSYNEEEQHYNSAVIHSTDPTPQSYDDEESLSSTPTEQLHSFSSESAYPPEPEPDYIVSSPDTTPAPITVEYEPIHDNIVEPVQQFGSETPEQPAPPPPSSPAVTFVKILLSIILGTIGFALIIALVTLITLRPGNIPNIVAGADVTWVLEETEIGDIIIEGLNQSDLLGADVDVYDIRSFLKHENVATEFGLVAEKYARAIADGDFSYYLSSKEIVSFIRAVSPEIREEFGVRFTSDDYDRIAKSINDYVDLRDFRVETVLEQANVDVTVPHAVFSNYLLIIIALLFALIVFNTVLLHRKKAGNSLLATGIPIVLSGLGFITAGLLIGPFAGLFGSNIVYGFIRLASGITAFLLIPGFILFVLGVVCIVMFFVARSVRAKRPQKLTEKNKGSTWIVIGLTTNLCVLIACGFLSLLFYLSL